MIELLIGILKVFLPFSEGSKVKLGTAMFYIYLNSTIGYSWMAFMYMYKTSGVHKVKGIIYIKQIDLLENMN